MDMPVASSSPTPRILVFATARWQLGARVAINFLERGCHVAALVPRGHPASCVRNLPAIHRFQPLAPLAALRTALEHETPDLIVPCDDAAALVMQELHGGTAGFAGQAHRWREVLERSAGNPGACITAGSRDTFMSLARQLGIRTPRSVPAATPELLSRWMSEHDAPVVLKSDFSFGGQGVVVIRDAAEAFQAWHRLHRRPGLLESLGRCLLEREASHLQRWWHSPPAGLSAQAVVDGHPANRAVACWRGEVLAGISVEALRQQHATGPATVMRVIQSAEMEAAAARLVRHLGVSGYVGFDFMIEAATGKAYLIQMNPRATPVCHLPDGRAAAMTAALLCRLGNEPLSLPVERPGPGLVVMFPGEWRADPESPYLQVAGHDVPWAHPGLVRDGLDRPWSERGWLARLKRRLVHAAG